MLGELVGTVSGLIPGLHPNLFGRYLGFYSTVAAVIFYQYFSHIREIFLMVPDESSVLSLHPMYKLYKAGLGFKALLLSNLGVLTSNLIAFIILPLLIPLIIEVYKFSKLVGWLFLLFSLMVLIITEKDKIGSAIVLAISGVLGLLSLPRGISPMLSGLFATPILVSKKNKHVKQKILWRVNISKRALGLGFLSSLFLIITPAIGPTQSAIITRTLTNDEEFLFAMGVIRGFDVVFAILMALLFGYSRNGAINQTKPAIAPMEIYPTVAFAIGLSFIAFIVSTELGRVIVNANFDLDKIKLLSLIALIIISFLTLGIKGVLIFVTASAIGLLCERLKIRRINLMGSLMIPSLSKKFI